MAGAGVLGLLVALGVVVDPRSRVDPVGEETPAVGIGWGRRRIAGLVALGGVAAGHGVGGHVAGLVGWRGVLAALSATVHLVGVVVWAVIIASVVTAGRKRAVVIRQVISPARIAAVATVVSGAITAWCLVPGGLDTRLSSWERLLVVKGLLVVVIVAVGWWSSRRGVTGRTRGAVVELGIGAVVLAVAAALTSTPPTDRIDVTPQTAQVVAGGVIAEVTVSPAATGPVELHVVMSPPGGTLQPVLDLDVEFRDPSGRIAPIPVDMAVAGPNHWSAPVGFPAAGRWNVVLVAEVRPRELVRFVAEFDIASGN